MRYFKAMSWTAFAALAAAVAVAGETAPAAPLAQEIRLEAWGKDLGQALASITKQAHVDVRVAASFLKPKDFSSYTLYLYAENITVRQAVEWIARAIGCRYRVETLSSVILTGSYDWLREPEEILIEPVASLLGSKEHPAVFEAKMAELVKVHTLFQAYSLRLEAPDYKLVAVLPARLKRILYDALIAMSQPGLPLQPPAGEILGEAETELLQALRKSVVVRYKNVSAEEAIKDLTLQSGINIAFDHTPFFVRPLPRLTLNLGQTTARQAIEALAEGLGLSGYEMWPPRSVWLTAAPHKWCEAASREILWENLAVRAYAIADLAQKFGGSEVVVHHLRRQVRPDAWLDPATAIVYHSQSGNLIVVAPPALHDKVLRELCRLQADAGDRSLPKALTP